MGLHNVRPAVLQRGTLAGPLPDPPQVRRHTVGLQSLLQGLHLHPVLEGGGRGRRDVEVRVRLGTI